MINVVSLDFHLRKFLVNVSAHVHDVILSMYDANRQFSCRHYIVLQIGIGFISHNLVLQYAVSIVCVVILYMSSNSNLYFPWHFAMFYSLSSL